MPYPSRKANILKGLQRHTGVCIPGGVVQSLALLLLTASCSIAQIMGSGPLADARHELTTNPLHAREMFSAYAAAHPENLEAQMGIAEADLALHRYETAELEFRKITATKPDQWVAHKDLVQVEAALNRWEEFDNERLILRRARDRNAPGITSRESDLIDQFDVTPAKNKPSQHAAGQHPEHWLVREYYEPAGRSLTRYNFELFTNGRVQEYISLESAQAAAAALTQGDVLRSTEQAPKTPITDFTLDWYTGSAHGTITRYPAGEPTYEEVRKTVLHWLRTHPQPETQ